MGNIIGNLIVTGASVTVPFTTKEIIIPYILHPYRLGGIPWKEPSLIKYATFYIVINLTLVFIFSMLSNMMATAKKCKKINVWMSAKNSKWPLIMGMIAMIVLFFLPQIKALPLIILAPLPYSDHIVTGLIFAVFVLVGSIKASKDIKKKVCTVSIHSKNVIHPKK